MALETRVFDVANYIEEPQDVFYGLQAELEEKDPQFLRMMLDAVLRARGGIERVAAESGVPTLEFAVLDSVDERAVRELAVRLMEAYRPAAVPAKVA